MRIEEGLHEKVEFDSNLEQWAVKANGMIEMVISGRGGDILRRRHSKGKPLETLS